MKIKNPAVRFMAGTILVFGPVAALFVILLGLVFALDATVRITVHPALVAIIFVFLCLAAYSLGEKLFGDADRTTPDL